MSVIKIRELKDLGLMYRENKNPKKLKIQIVYEEFQEDESPKDRRDRMQLRVKEENTICIMRNVKIPNIKNIFFFPSGDIMTNIRLKPKDPSQELTLDDNMLDVELTKVKNVYMLPFTDNSPLISYLLPYTKPWKLSQECDMTYDICILNNELITSLYRLQDTVSLQIDTFDGAYFYRCNDLRKLSKDSRETNPYNNHITTCDNDISVGILCTDTVQIGNKDTNVVINGVVFQNLLNRLEELENKVLELEYRPPELGGKSYEEALNSWRIQTELLPKK